MSSELTQRIAQEHAVAGDALPAGVVTCARRRRAIDALLAGGLPTARNENWRYANLRPLERVRFAPAVLSAPAVLPAPAAAAGAPALALEAERVRATLAERVRATLEQLPPIDGYARYVFVDGVLAVAESAPRDFASGVAVHAPVRASADGISLDVAWPAPDSAFALLNDAFAVDSAEIHVPGAHADHERSLHEEHLPACIEVVFIASAPAQQGASYPRLRATVEPHARLRLIERHVSLAAGGSSAELAGAADATSSADAAGSVQAASSADAASFVDAAVEVQVHDGAAVDHYRVQQLGPRATWMDTLSASVARSASYRLHTIGLGAQSARSTLRVRLLGDGAALALHAVAAGDRQQVLDQYAVVDHAAPHTRTEESFRGIASGRSRVAFNGKIIVQPGAHGADSSQSLRGLLAGADAEIDVRPQLEIYTDDVRCSHGATAGKLDETMLFYLLSRGLDRDTAQRLLKWAFLEDVVSRIAVAELRRQIESSLAGQIQESDALKELLHGRDRA